MVKSVPTGLMQATEIARQSDLRQSSNGVRYTAFGENNLESADLARIVQAVPASIASALGHKAYYFVPLALTGQSDTPGLPLDGIAQVDAPPTSSVDDTLIATTYTVEFSDRAICHRNVRLRGPEGAPDGTGNIDGVFISTRLLADRFALAFEFFINVSHAFVDVAGIPDSFADLAWKQARAEVRGETSMDAWESRAQALVDAKAAGQQTGGEEGTPSTSEPRIDLKTDERAKSEFIDAAFSDAIAIYLLSLAIDFDYAELRERDYPLLAPKALAERLQLIAKLFPPNAGYDFSIRYRRRK